MNQKLKYNVNYNDIKKILIKSSMKQQEELINTEFNIDYQKLSNLAKELNLVPIPVDIVTSEDKVNIESRAVLNNDIRLLQEYFKGENLKWLANGKRDYVNVVFVYTDGLSQDNINYIYSSIEYLLEGYSKSDAAEYDETSSTIISNILADFPCYVANDVSYISSDPDRANRISYNIQIRANTVVLKNDAYKYNHNDMV